MDTPLHEVAGSDIQRMRVDDIHMKLTLQLMGDAVVLADRTATRSMIGYLSVHRG